MGMLLMFIFFVSFNYIFYLIEFYVLFLQKFIVGVVGFILMYLYMNVIIEEIYIYVGGRIVEVVFYCVGLKMLFISFYVFLMLFDQIGVIKSCVKIIFLLISVVLFSVSVNILRNIMLIIFYGIGQDEVFYWLYDGWGGDMYFVCMLVLLILIMNWVNNFFINLFDFFD